MLKLLNYLSILLAGLCILGSCTIFKHRTEENQYTSAKHHQEKEVDFSYRKNDSLSRFWYFWTDSAFRFHPDSGFMGRSGGLIVRESMTSTVGENRSAHTVRKDDIVSGSERKSKTTRLMTFGGLIVIGFVLIILMVLFICRRKIRTF
ncbi:hypothetical protein [Sphingobacterium sp. UBA2074]|uniref:hypothetical protein n=1 Tax=Sphingobacterium sp. UBA2074 TaxID=1947487 RepID=UPI0025801EE0|nr:hypothetical protein [Sphingobacterium sp. UBA2074]